MAPDAQYLVNIGSSAEDDKASMMILQTLRYKLCYSNYLSHACILEQSQAEERSMILH